jgi:hypothetical protein
LKFQINFLTLCFRVVENGVETVETFENDILKSRTVNGQQQLGQQQQQQQQPQQQQPRRPSQTASPTPTGHFSSSQNIRIRRHI